ncbi:MAG: hypothetical protein V3U48_07945 [Rhodospirillales bacterium]
MTAEIVNLQEYRERKLRVDKVARGIKNDDAPADTPADSLRRARAGKGNEKTGTDGTEETLPEDLLDNDDENRGGEPT